MLEPEQDCLTCSLQPGSLSLKNEQNLTIADVLKKHFWFTEDDFQRTKICQSCWDQVNHFHQFYVSVEELYQHRLVSLAIKTEPEADGFLDSRLVVKSEPLEDCAILVKEEPAADIDDANKNESVDEEEQYPIEYQTKRRKYNKAKKLHEQHDDYIREHVKYICEQCSNESYSFLYYIKHMQNIHQDKKPYIMCCGKKYHRKTDLYSHVRVLNNPEEYRCKPCEKNYGNKWALLCHIKEIHSSDNERWYTCDQCPTSFVVESLFKKHVQDHARDFKCEHCNRCYKSSNNLSTHVNRRHPELQPFVCDMCPKSFRLEAWLRKHKQKHDSSGGSIKTRKRKQCNSEIGQHKCELCSKIFSLKESMVRHQRRIHQNEMQEFKVENEIMKISSD